MPVSSTAMVRAWEKIIINMHTASSQSTKWLMKQIKQNITYTIPLKIQKKKSLPDTIPLVITTHATYV